ncbi:phosphotransfer intermediate protein in two-component regulatory system with RcsBC [compost metagenome]
MSAIHSKEKNPTKIRHGSAAMFSGASIPVEYREVFVRTMEQDLVALNSALVRSDLRTVLSMLHRMHGAFAVIGIAKFAGRCETLEQEGRRNGLDDATEKGVAILARDLLKMLSLQQLN